MILDMSLPEREGFEVLQELRARGATLPVLVLTGRRERDAAMCLDAGADDYMSKPFSFAELLARVQVRIRTKEELDRLRRRVKELERLNDARTSSGLHHSEAEAHMLGREAP
jgi:DNA-binding response OmpR family regulator